MIRRYLAALALSLAIPTFAQDAVIQAVPVEIEELPQTDPSSEIIAPSVEPPPVPATPLAPTQPEAPAPDGKPAGDDAVRVQIFLDESLFGPGVIDGKPGKFSDLAKRAWNEAHGHSPDDWRPLVAAAQKAVPNPFAVAVVPDFIKDWVDPTLPTDYVGQGKRKRMTYRSVLELMAERYHTTSDYLTTLNPGRKLTALKARDSLVVPNVVPFPIESLTGKKYEADPLLSSRHVVVDTKMNQVRIFEASPTALVVEEDETGRITTPIRPNRALVASFPITPGQERFIKYGVWELKNSVELPYWRYDKSLLETGKRSSESINIPPGPNSPVGILWAGLNKPGIGLHGTSSPETIGRARSAGCIRLANWDILRLPTVVRPGASVEIR